MIYTNFELVGIGSPVIDVLAQVPDAFLEKVGGEKGGMVLTDPDSIANWMKELPASCVEVPGGSAGNTIFAATRLGLKTTFIGKTGNDAGGAFYRKQLEAIGGNSSHFKDGAVPNGRCLSLITPDGERTMRTDLGAAATLQPSEINPADFTGCSHAHIEGYLLFNPDLILAILKAAKEADCTVSLDLASFEVVNASIDILPELLETYVDLVFANEEEAAAYCGASKGMEEMARELGKTCELAVVKAGKQGSWIFREDQILHTPAIPGINALDTTGAGDFWAAGFLTAWLRGKPLDVCGAWGSRLGAEIVQVIGTELNEATWDKILQDLN